MKETICIIGPNKNLKGGIATVLNQYSKSYLKDKYDLKFISSYSESKVEFLKGLIKYLKIRKSIKVCHIHVASNGSFLRKSLFSFLTPKNVPILFHVHGGGFINFYNKSNRLLKSLIEKNFNRAFKVVVVSEYFKSNFIKIFNLEESKIIKIHNGIYIKEENIDLDLKKKQVLYLGKLTKSKGVYDLIKIISKVHKCDSNIKFIIAGNGEIENVKNEINKLSLNGCVDVVGWANDEKKKKLLEESSILVVPSHFESFGISIVEAMAKGLVIIANNVGGVPDIVLNKLNGKLIRNNNIDSFKDEIIFYAQNNQARNEVAKNNLKRYLKFDINNMIKQIDNLYEEILK